MCVLPLQHCSKLQNSRHGTRNYRHNVRHCHWQHAELKVFEIFSLALQVTFVWMRELEPGLKQQLSGWEHLLTRSGRLYITRFESLTFRYMLALRLLRFQDASWKRFKLKQAKLLCSAPLPRRTTPWDYRSSHKTLKTVFTCWHRRLLEVRQWAGLR